MALVLPLEVWMKRRSFLFSVFLLLMVINASYFRQNGNQANAQVKMVNLFSDSILLGMSSFGLIFSSCINRLKI